MKTKSMLLKRKEKRKSDTVTITVLMILDHAEVVTAWERTKCSNMTALTGTAEWASPSLRCQDDHQED